MDELFKVCALSYSGFKLYPAMSPLRCGISVVVQSEVLTRGSSGGQPGGGCGEMLEPLTHPSLSRRSCEAGKNPDLIPSGGITAPPFPQQPANGRG